MCVCMGCLYHYIVACAHLENGTGRRTPTMAAPLLLTRGLVRYEAVVHSCGTNSVCVCVWRRGGYRLGVPTAGTMTCYPTQSHYLDTEPTSPCPTIIMPSAGLVSILKSFV